MNNENSDRNDGLSNLLAERVDANRADLVGQYQRILQESLFGNRALVRPNILKQVAIEEADAFHSFLSQPGFSGVERGEKLHQAGFNIGSVLKLSQVTCQFLLGHLEDHQFEFILETVDTYRRAVAEGFIQSIEKEHRVEMEQTRNALQRGAS